MKTLRGHRHYDCLVWSDWKPLWNCYVLGTGVFETRGETLHTYFNRYPAQKVNKDSRCLHISNLERSETSRTCRPNTSENLVHSSFTNVYWTSVPAVQFLIHHAVPGVVARVSRSSEDTWISELSWSTGCP